jgi:heavy metal-binding protein
LILLDQVSSACGCATHAMSDDFPRPNCHAGCLEIPMLRIFALLVAAILINGCAAQPDLNPYLGSDPGNPESPESAVVDLPQPLSLNSPTPAAGAEKTDASRQPDLTATRPTGSARPETNATSSPTTSGEQYTCKMHPQVVSTHPGNCPICGMKLVLKGGGK